MAETCQSRTLDRVLERKIISVAVERGSDKINRIRYLTSTVHREVEKVTKIGKKNSKPNFSTNNSDSSNRFSAPESPLPKLSNGQSLGWELAPLLG